MVFFALAVAFVTGIMVASVLWARDVRWKDRQATRGPAATGEVKLPFRRSRGVLNEAQASVYKMVKYVIADDGHVLAQVPLSALVTLEPSQGRREFYLQVARSRQVDMVVCHGQSFAPVLVVQVNDAGIKRDEEDQDLIERTLVTVGLPLLQLSAKEAIGPVELKQKIRDAMNQMPPPGSASSSSSRGQSSSAA